MNDTYYEMIVKRKIGNTGLLCRFLVIIATVIAISLGVLVLGMYGVMAGILFIYLDIVVFRNTDTEYEYQFISGDLDIDVIFGKMKRKRARRFDMRKMEILAPVGSDRLSYYSNNNRIKVLDYSSGYSDRDKYAFITTIGEGQTTKVIFEPDEKMIETIKSVLPSKVHTN